MVQSILHQVCSLAMVHCAGLHLHSRGSQCWKVTMTMYLLDSLRLCLGTSAEVQLDMESLHSMTDQKQNLNRATSM